jgi:phage terminase large subunit
MAGKKLTAAEKRKAVERGRCDPEWWCLEVLGFKPWSLQETIIESVRDNRQTSVASCHGAGKTAIAARIALWFLCNHPSSIVLTTAPSKRQVRDLLWKEIGVAHRDSLYPLGGKRLQQELRLSEDWFALGFTAPEWDPNKFQGFHAKDILVIADEASGVSRKISEAIAGVLSSENARFLRIGNPTDINTDFGDSFKTPGVRKIYCSAFDTPNFTEFGITQDDIVRDTWRQKITGPLPNPNLVTPEWVAERFRSWGNSPLYLSRVLAKFPKQSKDTLIALSHIEAAQTRALEKGEPHELGVDVARYGDDKSSICERWGPVARVRDRFSKTSTMETAGRTKIAIEESGATSTKIDTVGIGSGVYDRLEEQGMAVVEANAGAGSSDKEKYLNARSEWFWSLHERFESGDIDIDPDDEELAAQLSSIRYKCDSRGRIVIESKEDMKKRGIPSPNDADALAMVFAKIDKNDAEFCFV